MRVAFCSDRTLGFIVLLLLGAAAFLIYGETFYYPWLFDDIPVIVNNTDIRSLAGFVEDSYPGRPVREISFLIDYYFFGLDPGGFHFQNILWHLFNGFIIYLLSLMVGLSRVFSILAALIFIVHPVNVEVVAQTSHRKDSLCLFFILSGLISYFKFTQSSPNKFFYLFLTVACFITALLSKEMAILFPVALLTFEYLVVQKEKRIITAKRIVFPTAVFLFLAVIIWRVLYLQFSGKVYQHLEAVTDQIADISVFSLKSYYLTIVKSQLFLFSKWICPINLAPEYTFFSPSGFLDIWVIGGVFLFLGFVLFFVWAFKHDKVIAFTLIWIFLFWLPTSHVLGHFSYLAADRYLYTPGAGLAIMCGNLLQRLPWRKVSLVVSAILVVLLCSFSIGQVKNWSSSAALSLQIGKVNPYSVENQITTAATLIDGGDYDEAISRLRTLALRRPTYGKIYRYLAMAYYKDGDINEAIRHVQLWINFRPNDFEAYNFLGSFMDEKGETSKAVDAFEKSISINRLNESAYTNLGVLYERLGKLELAVDLHKKAVSNLPDYGMGYYNLGVAYYRLGDKQKAFDSFDKATKLLTDDADVLFNYGYVAAELGYFSPAEISISALKRIDSEKAVKLQEYLDSRRKAGLNDKLRGVTGN